MIVQNISHITTSADPIHGNILALTAERLSKVTEAHGAIHATQSELQCVDFSNTAEAKAFGLQILSYANEAKMFVTTRPCTCKQEKIKDIAKEWVCRVEDTIAAISPSHALELIEIFDIVHRIGYNIPAKTAFLDRYKLRAFEAYVHGDTSVDQYILFNAISAELARHNEAYYGRPLDWYVRTLEGWYRNFRTGRSAIPQSDRDILCQVTALLRADLTAFIPSSKAFKQILATNHIGLFGGVG